MERRTIQKAYIYILAFAFFVEFFGFNHRAMLSLFAREQTPEVTDAGNVLFLTDIEGDPGYIYLDTAAVPAEEIDGAPLPVTVSISAEDDGNSSEYELGSTTIYPLLEKSKYFRVHTYGEPSVIKLELSAPVEAEFNTKAVTVSASVPVFFSFFRFLGTFFILLLIYILRPASSVYSSALFEKRLPRRAMIAGAILLNICLLTVSVNLVPTFHNPGWLYHSQYQRLAESFIEGRLDIDMDREEALSEIGRLSNP